MKHKVETFEISQNVIEETIMIALETQFISTALQQNKDVYQLHKRTEYALAMIYKSITERKTDPDIQTTILSKKLYKTYSYA